MNSVAEGTGALRIRVTGRPGIRPLPAGRLCAVLAVAVAFVVLVVQRRLLYLEVQGDSMAPTLMPRQAVLAVRPLFGRVPIRRGDIVVLRHDPAVFRTSSGRIADSLLLIKRVVGLPGERVQVRQDMPRVDGLQGPLPAGGATGSHATRDAVAARDLVVPNDALYVLGDNRAHSSDSRLWGPVHRRHIVGRAWLVAVPRWRRIASDPDVCPAAPPGAPAPCADHVTTPRSPDPQANRPQPDNGPSLRRQASG